MSRESFSSNSFLNSFQAAEAYHRYRRCGTDIPEADHEMRIKSIIDASPKDHRKWLSEKLQYSNEVGLRKRLKELLNERADLFEFTSSDITRYAYRITKIRNYFTHYSGEKDPEFATGQDFYIYDTLMQWTVTACLLEEMGINREQSHKLILRNQSFIFFKSVYLKNRQLEIMKFGSINQENVQDSQEDEPEEE